MTRTTKISDELGYMGSARAVFWRVFYASSARELVGLLFFVEILDSKLVALRSCSDNPLCAGSPLLVLEIDYAVFSSPQNSE